MENGLMSGVKVSSFFKNTMKAVEEDLNQGELLLVIAEGVVTCSEGNKKMLALLVVTDERVIVARKGLFSNLEISIPVEFIGIMDLRRGLFKDELIVKAVGDKICFKGKREVIKKCKDQIRRLMHQRSWGSPEPHDVAARIMEICQGAPKDAS